VSEKLVFPCPACQSRIRSRTTQSGLKVRCPKCDTEVTVPGTPALNAPALNAPALNAPALNAPALNAPALNAPALNAPALNAPALNAQANSAPVLEARVTNVPAPPPMQVPQRVAGTTELPKPVLLKLPADGEEPSARETAKERRVKERADSIHVRCPSCQTAVDAPRSQLGKTVTCPDCHTEMKVRDKKTAVTENSGRDQAATSRAQRSISGHTDSFGYACSLCGTRLYAHVSQIGTEGSCPDCHSSTLVPAPSKTPVSKPGTITPSPSNDGGELRLEEVSERPRYQPIDTGKVSRKDLAFLQEQASPVGLENATAAVTPLPQHGATGAAASGDGASGVLPAAPASSPASARGFAVPCPHCGERLQFRQAQSGKRLRCGGCSGEFVVRAPNTSVTELTTAARPVPAPKTAAPKTVSGTAKTQLPEMLGSGSGGHLPDEDDDKFTLSEVVERPSFDPLARNHQARAHSDDAADPMHASRSPPPIDQPYVPSQPVDVLATAAAAAAEQEAGRLDIESLGYFRRTFGILAQPEALARLGILVGLDAALMWLLRGAAIAATSDGMGKAMATIYILIGVMVFVPWSMGVLANSFSITADTASGADRIENWPEDIYSDWIGNAVTMFVIAVVAGIPGSILWMVVMETTHSYLLATWSLISCFWIFFPIALLSVLEGDGLGSLISPPILSSVQRAFASWAQLFIESILLSAAMSQALSILQNDASFLLILVFSTVKISLMFIHFRLIGVLGFRVARQLNAHEEKLAAQESLNSPNSEALGNR
jgi:DNA-directed RNA polymerase subunit RPC12/RpoP